MEVAVAGTGWYAGRLVTGLETIPGKQGDPEMRRKACGFTLWDLATVIREEAEKVFAEEPVIREVSNVVLLHMIRTRVKNMEVAEKKGRSALRGAHAES
jgi:hypothetical protein